jgi:hypothetical protein
MDTAIILRWSVTGLAVIGVIVWLLAWRTHPRYRLAMFAPLSWLVHIVVFYLVREYGGLTVDALNIWSNAVRMHSLILCVGLGAIVAWK